MRYGIYTPLHCSLVSVLVILIPQHFLLKKNSVNFSDVILSINASTYLSVWIACLKALTSSGDLWSRLLVVDFYCVLILFLSEIFVLKHKYVAFRNMLCQSINMLPKTSLVLFLKRCWKYTVEKIHPLYVQNHLVTLENEKKDYICTTHWFLL